MSSNVLKNMEEIGDVLRDITFAPSCVDMGWEWEVEAVFVHSGPAVHVAEITAQKAVPAGYRIRTTFRRPDRDGGKDAKGFGRWWEVPLDVTVSGVVKTAFAAAKMILEHELMESFKWQDCRVFDPHNDVEGLAGLNPSTSSRCRYKLVYRPGILNENGKKPAQRCLLREGHLEDHEPGLKLEVED